VRAASTVNVTLASAVENGDTLDGVTLATGDRILLKNQTTGSENGIYTVNASGAPTRATDADAGAELVNAAVYVSEGTTNADTAWTCTNNATPTLGSTALTFTQIGNGNTYVGDGTSIDVSGTTISIKSSAALPGSPTTTTQSAGDNSTKIATTAYVENAIGSSASVPAWATNHPDTVPSSPNANDREFQNGDTIGGTTLGSPGTAPAIVDNSLKITGGTSGTEDVKAVVWTAPSTPYTVVTKIRKQSDTDAFGVSGLMLRSSVSGRFYWVGIFHNNGTFTDYFTIVNAYNSLTSRATNLGNYSLNQSWLYVKITNDGTTASYYASHTGYPDSYKLLQSETLSTHFTGGNLPDQVGVGVDSFSGTGRVAYFDYLRFS